MHMQKQTHSLVGHPWRIVVATLLAMALVVLWRGQHLYAAELAAPAAQGAPADNGGDNNGGDDIKVYGLLEVSSTVGLSGTWAIKTVSGTVSYTATANTLFSTAEHGDFVIGGCVEIEVSSGNPTVAKEIGTEEMSKCTGVPDDDDDDDDIKRFGRIVSLTPEGELTRTLVISGTSSTIAYTITAATEFENEHGGFILGACVKVESSLSSPTVAKEIETEPAYKCSGQMNGDEAHGELFGTVNQLPDDGLIGIWIVGTKNISVTEQTEVRSADAITEGVTVKVEFIVISDTLVATEIKLKFGRHDGDDDDHGDFGDHNGREGHAFGVINGIPTPAVPGVWEIGHISYTVTERTKFDDGEELKADVLVEVKYFVQEDGSRIAFKIETEDGHGRLDNPNVNKLVGTVEMTPTTMTGFVGLWLIAGAEFSATVDTRFHEEHGLLGPDAYVEVLYVIENGVRVIVKIETHVPPGAGDDNSVGKVESEDDSAAAVAAVSATAIVVEGVSYSVNPATQIIDTNGEVVVGSTVAVNSYKTVGGQSVATRIRSVTLNNVLVMPYIQR